MSMFPLGFLPREQSEGMVGPKRDANSTGHFIEPDRSFNMQSHNS